MLLFLIMLLNLSPAKKAIMLSPLHTPVKVITFPLILDCDNVIFALDSYMESILWIAKKSPKDAFSWVSFAANKVGPN